MMWSAIIAAINRIANHSDYARGRADGWDAAVKLWNETYANRSRK